MNARLVLGYRYWRGNPKFQVVSKIAKGGGGRDVTAGLQHGGRCHSCACSTRARRLRASPERGREMLVWVRIAVGLCAAAGCTSADSLVFRFVTVS